jgi:uncharacterized protein YfiM (DUF2279 family)
MKKPLKKRMTVAVSNRVHYATISFLLLGIVFFSHSNLFSQDSVSVQYKRKRLPAFVIGSSTVYAASMTGLYQLWYKNSKHQPFTFFNDNAEWKQVDKVGHLFSSFYIAYGAQRCLRWTGLEKKKADKIGAATAFLLLVPIEIFDGYSDAYGASTGDLAADAGGAALFYGQQLLWNEVRINPKFSFHTTRYSMLRPNVLGGNLVSQSFKDYNGQTYWFSFDMDKFVPFPKWLNLAAGYGAEDMIFARDHQNHNVGFNPYRQYYLSIDIDLSSIRTRSKVLKTLIFMAGMIKIPAPTISFSQKGARLHALYF